jgi:hypothetical protein
MAFQQAGQDARGHEAPIALQIAHNPYLTVFEKLEMLDDLKFEIEAAHARGEQASLSEEEIDEAIEELKLQAERGRSGYSGAGDH